MEIEMSHNGIETQNCGSWSLFLAQRLSYAGIVIARGKGIRTIMRQTLALFLGSFLALFGVVSVSAGYNLTIHVSVSGLYVMEKLSDSECRFSGGTQTPTVEIVVDGEIEHSEKLDLGDWKPAVSGNDFPTCSTSFEVELPEGDNFIIRFVPWDERRVTQRELQSGQVDVEVLRPEGTEPTIESRETTSRQSEPAASNNDDNADMVAQVPNVEQAYTVDYSNISESSLFSEPLNMFFTAYDFNSEDEAEAGFDVISQDARTTLGRLAETDEEPNPRVNETSVGRIGDDRNAFSVDEPLRMLWVVVRQEDQILSVFAMGLDGEYEDFVGEFLEDHLAEIQGEDRSIIPELSDMPRGWEAGRPLEDVTDQVGSGT